VACDQTRSCAFLSHGREHGHWLAAAQFGSRISGGQGGQPRASWVEPASRRDHGGIGRLASQHFSRTAAATREHRDKRLGVRVARLEQDLAHLPDLDDPAQVHDGHPVGDVPGDTEVMADDESGQG
jgi:hypothetical protein